eukprot:gene3765-14311_t
MSESTEGDTDTDTEDDTDTDTEDEDEKEDAAPEKFLTDDEKQMHMDVGDDK